MCSRAGRRQRDHCRKGPQRPHHHSAIPSRISPRRPHRDAASNDLDDFGRPATAAHHSAGAFSLPSSAKPPRGEGAVFSEDGVSANGRVLPAAVGNDLPLCLTAWRLSALAFTAPFRAKRGGCWATADRRGFSARRNNRARTRQIGDEMVACARKPLRPSLLQTIKPRRGGGRHQGRIVGPAGRGDPVGGRQTARGLQREARRGRSP